MGFEPTHAERIVFSVKRLNHSATLSDQRSSNGKLNRTNKKWSKDASLQIEYYFRSKQKTYQSKPLFDQK